MHQSTSSASPVHFGPAYKKRRRRPRRPAPKLRPKGNPRRFWPEWTRTDRWTLAEPVPPSDDSPEFTPSPAAEAWNAGFERGFDHDEAAVPSADLPEALTLSWWHGRNVGWLQREEDDLLIDRFNEACAPVGDDVVYRSEIRETDLYSPGATT